MFSAFVLSEYIGIVIFPVFPCLCLYIFIFSFSEKSILRAVPVRNSVVFAFGDEFFVYFLKTLVDVVVVYIPVKNAELKAGGVDSPCLRI